MGLILEYSFKGKPKKEGIKVCDDAAHATQDMIVELAKLIQPKMVWLIWFMTRIYTRKITDDKITYHFPLLK